MRRFATFLITSMLASGLILPLSVEAAKSSTKSPATSSSGQPANISNDVTQSYNADASVQIGMMVKLKDKDPKSVEPLAANQADKMLGVVIPSSNAAIVLTPQSVSQQQVLVTNNGHFELLISNQNGPIKVGDYIIVSAIAGVGAKATENSDTQVVGKAAGNFTGSANVIGQVNLQDTLGRKSTVSLGRIPVDIAISHNPIFQRHSDYVPAGLGKLAAQVATHPVSTARIYLGAVILVVTAFITGNMFYSGVRGGMIAVGRNPLSRKSIMRSLVQTVIAGLIVFTGGVFGVYLLLKL